MHRSTLRKPKARSRFLGFMQLFLLLGVFATVWPQNAVAQVPVSDGLSQAWEAITAAKDAIVAAGTMIGDAIDAAMLALGITAEMRQKWDAAVQKRLTTAMERLHMLMAKKLSQAHIDAIRLNATGQEVAKAKMSTALVKKMTADDGTEITGANFCNKIVCNGLVESLRQSKIQMETAVSSLLQNMKGGAQSGPAADNAAASLRYQYGLIDPSLPQNAPAVQHFGSVTPPFSGQYYGHDTDPQYVVNNDFYDYPAGAKIQNNQIVWPATLNPTPSSTTSAAGLSAAAKSPSLEMDAFAAMRFCLALIARGDSSAPAGGGTPANFAAWLASPASGINANPIATLCVSRVAERLRIGQQAASNGGALLQQVHSDQAGLCQCLFNQKKITQPILDDCKVNGISLIQARQYQEGKCTPTAAQGLGGMDAAHATATSGLQADPAGLEQDLKHDAETCAAFHRNVEQGHESFLRAIADYVQRQTP